MCGGAITGMSSIATEYELQRQFSDSQCSVVLCCASNLSRVLEAAKSCTNIKAIIVITDETSNGRRVCAPRVSGQVLYYWSDAVIEQPSVWSLETPEIMQDIAIMPYSSGTTGRSKGVMISHQNLATATSVLFSHVDKQVFARTIKDWSWKDDRTIAMLPFYHIYGCCMMLLSLFAGSTTITVRRFSSETFCKNIQHHKIRFLTVVPTLLTFLAKSPDVRSYDLTSVSVIVCGAAPAGKELIDAVFKRHPNIRYIMQGYGMTEVTAASHLPVPEQPIGSSGKLAPDFQMKIVNIDDGTECDVNEPGEIQLRSPTVMVGYFNRPSETAQIITEDGWLCTGDVGYVDENGFLFIVDRMKELIKVSGFQVAPAELEDILLKHPAISEVAVVGVPDQTGGELPKAFIVTRDGTQISEQEINDFMKDKVSHYKYLRGGVSFLSELPKSPVGKILRRRLRDENHLNQQCTSEVYNVDSRPIPDGSKEEEGKLGN
ncbi:hypothetical protein AB6A40_006967 [Gnathostoma spinigerum]|uniref:4-coumarate--CoA ligase n=1 Tax=Gnathostoma spinigerum TaxID=75299 RepID=A0ABD6EJV4_9BILA